MKYFRIKGDIRGCACSQGAYHEGYTIDIIDVNVQKL
jgi:hypothetical protein